MAEEFDEWPEVQTSHDDRDTGPRDFDFPLAVAQEGSTDVEHGVADVMPSEGDEGSKRSFVYKHRRELAVVIAVALLFSSFSSTILSALFTLGVYFAGHLSNQLLEQIRFASRMGEMGDTSTALLEKVAVVIHAVFPGLYRYNVTSYVVHGLALPDMYLFWNTVYAIGYVGVFLAIASWWFSRRDFL